MTRGNQRDLAREKNAKKQAEQKKRQGAGNRDGNAGSSLESRMHRDAETMRLKQQQAEAKKAAEQQGGANATKTVKYDPLA